MKRTLSARKAGLFSRDCTDSSRADYVSSGFATGMAGTAKAANGEIEIIELIFGQDEEEGLEEDDGFFEAGGQVELASVQDAPETGDAEVRGVAALGNSRAVVAFDGIDNAFEGENLVQE